MRYYHMKIGEYYISEHGQIVQVMSPIGNGRVLLYYFGVGMAFSFGISRLANILKRDYSKIGIDADVLVSVDSDFKAGLN